MTIEAFKEMMVCNEPDFEYNGKEYNICCYDGTYYAGAYDSSDDEEQEFESLDDLLDHWIVEGKPFREIVPFLEFDEIGNTAQKENR